MIEESPFSLRRFETERRHLYYLPKDLLAKLEGRKSVYLIGSRGTGKTTLLNALNWEEQCENPELLGKLNELGAGKGYIGIYMRMPQTVADMFDQWIPTAGEKLRAAVFCLYLDLTWIQSACDAIAHMVLTKQVRAAASKEYKVTEQLMQRYPELAVAADLKRPLSIKSFGALLYQKRRVLERWVLSGIDRPADEITGSFPLAQIGEFGRVAASGLATFCETFASDRQPWHFRLCLDESECLTPFQQRALNTAVRLLRAPISYVIAYVRLVDVTNTFIRGVSLQDADRELILLDGMSDAQFTEFAEGVATVRIQKLSPNSEPFKTRSVFGTMDINELLQGILNTSASPEAKKVLHAAEELAQSPYYTETWDRTSVAPPIYQAYIVSRLALVPPSPQSERWEKRKQHSAEIRKRMVAAYLCLCKELNTQVKYAGAEMLLQMSDNCIRDYLSQMDAVFALLAVAVDEFERKRVAFDQQHLALTQASNRKKEAIPKSEIGSPIETLRLIESLAQLTARLQTTTKGSKSLKSPERGIFVMECEASSGELSDTMRLITEVADAGFLKMLTPGDKTIKFRIHCSLAAAYGISYRGAYYECILRSQDCVPLYREANADARADKVVQLGDRLLGEDTVLPLFEGTS